MRTGRSSTAGSTKCATRRSCRPLDSDTGAYVGQRAGPMSGYTYVQSERNLWTVGRYSGPHGERWEPESDHSNEQAAQRRLHDLTYGTDPLLERVERLERAVTLLAR